MALTLIEKIQLQKEAKELIAKIKAETKPLRKIPLQKRFLEVLSKLKGISGASAPAAVPEPNVDEDTMKDRTDLERVRRADFKAFDAAVAKSLLEFCDILQHAYETYGESTPDMVKLADAAMANLERLCDELTA